MDTYRFVEAVYEKIGHSNFLTALDDAGWRGVSKGNPVEYLHGYLGDHNGSYAEMLDLDSIVNDDMVSILHDYGYDIVNDEIVDIVPR